MTTADDSFDPAADAAGDPAAMYELIDRQQREIAARQGAIVPLLMLTWGIAWLAGFGALWLVDGLRPGFGLAAPIALAVFIVVTVAALAISTVAGIRSSSGIRGTAQNAFTGMVYGSTWTVGVAGIVLIGIGLTTQGMSQQLAGQFYPIAYVFFTGIMYVLAGAIWQAKPSVVIGVALVVMAAAASFLPTPLHFLFFAVLGGGTFVTMSIVSARWVRAARVPVVR